MSPWLQASKLPKVLVVTWLQVLQGHLCNRRPQEPRGRLGQVRGTLMYCQDLALLPEGGQGSFENHGAR